MENEILKLCSLLLDFGRRERLTCHQDGRTHESLTDHTCMLSIVACSLASKLYKNLDIGLVAQLALAHDLLEVYDGDIPTLKNVDTNLLLKKKAQEEYALKRMKLEFADTFPWIHETIEKYERCESEEAKFVKILDKLLPKVTVNLNNAKFLIDTKYVSRSEAKKTYDFQRKNLHNISKNFPLTMELWEYFVDKELNLLS